MSVDVSFATREPAVFDVDLIRQDFPILQRKINGKPLVYLDNAATSQKPETVIEAIDEYYRNYNANIHRGVYQIAEEATARYEASRRKMARFINARTSSEVIFTKGATEAINLVAYSWGRANIKEGDVILLTEMEHHSNLVPWQLLAREKGASLEFISIDEKGFLRLEDLDRFLTERTKLVAVTQMSNVLGTINPVKQIVEAAHRVGAVVLVDGAQSVPHTSVDVQEIGCDFLAFSGHKMLGPTGVGILYGRREILEEMNPFLGGGEMIKEVQLRDSTWNDLPWKFEAGTPNIAEGIVLGNAVDYLNAIGMKEIRQHEKTLVKYAFERLREIEGIKVFGPPPGFRGGVIAFNVDHIHPHDVATLLDREAIAIRAGHHCAQPLHQKLGEMATARISFYLYNTPEEVDTLIDALTKVRRVFRL